MIADQTRRIVSAIYGRQSEIDRELRTAPVSQREALIKEYQTLLERANRVMGTNNRYVDNIYNTPAFREASARAERMTAAGNTREAKRLMRVAFGRLYSRREYMRRNS